MDQSPNQDWVTRLSASGAEQSDALSELRQILFERIQRAFRSNHKVDDSFIEDVVQNGLIAILSALDDFQGRSQFVTWCTTITVRIAFSELRRRRWKDVSLEHILESRSTEVPLPTTEVNSEEQMQRSQIVDAMRTVIREQLTDKQRTVLEAELKGMPQSEIARHLGSTRNAIYKVGHDARKKLKQGMMGAGYSTEDLNIFKGATL